MTTPHYGIFAVWLNSIIQFLMYVIEMSADTLQLVADHTGHSLAMHNCIGYTIQYLKEPCVPVSI